MLLLVKITWVFKMPLISMSYEKSDHVISTGIKKNHTQKFLDKNFVILHERSPEYLEVVSMIK